MENQFFRRLSELLEEKEITKKDFARAIGVSPAAVTYWTSGLKQPTAENIYQTALFFDESADYLLGLTNEK